MDERIRELRKALRMTQEQFASELGLSRNFIALLETGSRVPSDRTVSDICRVYHVSEDWLRTGEGDMYAELPENRTAAIVSDLLEDDSPMNRLILNVLERYQLLDPVSREVIDRFIDSLLEERH